MQGWASINITTSKRFSDTVQAYAAGYMEGALSVSNIFDFFRNQATKWGFADRKYTPKLISYMTDNLQFLKDQIKIFSNASQSETVNAAKEANTNVNLKQYWRQIEILLAQFNGMVDGYQRYCTSEQRLEALDLYFLQAAGDMENLIGGL